MRHECHIVFMLTRNIYTKAISEVTMLNCFATMPQAKASLQYEYDIDMESCNPMDETDRPVWLNEDHTELRTKPGYDPSYETVIYIDSSVTFHDRNEPCFKYPINEESQPPSDEERIRMISEFRMLDSVCFVHEFPDGQTEIVRGRLSGMTTCGLDDNSIACHIDRMTLESTGEPFLPMGYEPVKSKFSVPLTQLHRNPADALEAYKNKKKGVDSHGKTDSTE